MPQAKRKRDRVEDETVKRSRRQTQSSSKQPPSQTSSQQAIDVHSNPESVYETKPSPRVSSPWKFGPHVSAAGGVENAVLNAAKIGATAFALFLKSQRKWVGKDLSESSIAAFKRRMVNLEYDTKHVLPHGSYLVNLGNPNLEKREKSYSCFLDDLKRCEQLGLVLYNFHPGSTVGQATINESLSYVAQYINRAHKETAQVTIVIENMAGAGNILGSKFSEIGTIIRDVEDKTRVGVCLDTCHMFAAGYDIRTKDGWNSMMSEFEREIGTSYLRGMHINDSKSSLGSGKDRHQNLGIGNLGLHSFAHILSDPRTQDIPLILETPAHDSDKAPGSKRKGQKGVTKAQGNTDDEHGDATQDESSSPDQWEVWKKEVNILGQLAALNVQDPRPSPDECKRLMDKWKEEIRALVMKRSGSGALVNETSQAKKVEKYTRGPKQN